MAHCPDTPGLVESLANNAKYMAIEETCVSTVTSEPVRGNKPILPPWTVTRLIVIAVIRLFGQLGCV